MGDNFSKRFPTIYKYGKFKRALRFWKEDQYVKAYKEIAEAFHIDVIKKHFDPTYRPSMFIYFKLFPQSLGTKLLYSAKRTSKLMKKFSFPLKTSTIFQMLDSLKMYIY